MTSERYDGPIPPGHGEGNPDVRDASDPVPVCPVCGGMMTRAISPVVIRTDPPTFGTVRGFACHVHGRQQPRWEYV